MYYTIDNSTDKDVGNTFPQVSPINHKLAQSIPFDEFVNLDSELLFELQPKAKLTDVLSQATISAHGLLINKKVKDLFEGFNIMKHRYYKCLVKDLKGITHDYYWLHISDYSVLDKINYRESKFYLRESGFREKDIELTSYTDYKNKMKSLGIHYTISADQLVLSTEFNNSINLFVIPIFASKKIFITENLKEFLLSKQITGVVISSSKII